MWVMKGTLKACCCMHHARMYTCMNNSLPATPSASQRAILYFAQALSQAPGGPGAFYQIVGCAGRCAKGEQSPEDPRLPHVPSGGGGYARAGNHVTGKHGMSNKAGSLGC